MPRSEYEYATIRVLLPLIIAFWIITGICYALGVATIWAIEMVFGR